MAMSHTGPRNNDGAHPRPDPTRIAGISGTLLFNGCAFLLLLIPMTQPALLSLPDRVPDLTWIDPKPVPPPPPPARVPVVSPPAAAVAPMPRAVPVAAPPRDPAIATGPTPDTGPALEMVASGTPVAGSALAPALRPGVRLEYAFAPPPTYPRQALLDGSQGTVVLEVLVGIDGRPRDVRVHVSSGDRRLDDTARRQVLRRWIFQPAMQDGRAVEALGLVPVDFHLGRS